MDYIRSLKNANGWKCRGFYCYLVAVYYFETVLKNFGKWHHKGVPSHAFHQSFYKDFVVLVFWNKYCPFVTIFIMTDWKPGPICEILYFHLTH